jgi:ech hydrogenase subunit F
MASMFSIISKNISKKPATRLYPDVVREPFERTRGRLFNKIEDCIFCGICQRECPADAIKVSRPDGTWELDAFRCITCNQCVLKCPKKCLTLTNERRSSGEKKTVHLKKVEVETDATIQAQAQPQVKVPVQPEAVKAAPELSKEKTEATPAE